jgi:hypothetical protein
MEMHSLGIYSDAVLNSGGPYLLLTGFKVSSVSFHYGFLVSINSLGNSLSLAANLVNNNS